ncbi:MAG: sigma-54-dependent Fis family transcriptional regulator, partial [FCB group bacterium]|nr:sigma-54-dependent Fis family transcriptional regulator [FCB group bacterium]
MDLDRLQRSSGILGRSDEIREVMEMVLQVAPVDISVLITGESGTGKELVAKAIHYNSRRSQFPLVIVNSGAIPSGIIESELFGHKKGAYTGASEDRKGYFETANKGTLFLDELGETPLETQVKLLRILETGEFMRVGDSKTLHTDVRLITATNKDLEEQVRNGEFRQDLYYRLKTVTIHVPPLRHRIEDLSMLVERFALEFTTSNDIRYRGFTPDAIRIMKQYDWPGNIRELKNYVESILVLERGERITAEMVERSLFRDKPVEVHNRALPVIVNQPADQAERELILRQLFALRQDTETIKQILSQGSMIPGGIPALPGAPTEFRPVGKIDQSPKLIRDEAIGDMTLKELEQEAIERTLKYFGNNRRAAARSLGMSERTLYRKIDDFGLERKIKRPDH